MVAWARQLIGPACRQVRIMPRASTSSAAEYLRQSIVDPSAYLVEGYPAIMPAGFDRLLTPEQLTDLVAYLESLR